MFQNGNIIHSGFNTVNGKYCCNGLKMDFEETFSSLSFNTVNGKYCCNLSLILIETTTAF